MTLASILITAVFSCWRAKFKKLIKEAKSVFDNPLMAYLYSGNNNAISAITLALKMRTQQSTGEINALLSQLRAESEFANTAMMKGTEPLSTMCILIRKDRRIT